MAPTYTWADRPACQLAPGAGARNGTASTQTRSPGPATGSSAPAFGAARFGAAFVAVALFGAAFAGALRVAVVVVRAVLRVELEERRRRPGTGELLGVDDR
ncbi:hypothetical protein GCM10023328_07160 [Modestobacter marinus]|uniref:Uncharacterized protein n=1 Tax=Modestobacter marinus TaxID=477641 RepID=A0ABQ2FSJ6_9ACTN|nr:hypothetical protein GCM10011589_02800 [Modestobacter marinus]